jgi:hypothetical protein
MMVTKAPPAIALFAGLQCERAIYKLIAQLSPKKE